MASRAFGRSLADFAPLLPAEEKLRAACARGEPCKLGDTVPDKASEANRVRAEFVRFLLLGEDEETPVHESGVHLEGAWFEEALKLTELR